MLFRYLTARNVRDNSDRTEPEFLFLPHNDAGVTVRSKVSISRPMNAAAQVVQDRISADRLQSISLAQVPRVNRIERSSMSQLLSGKLCYR